MMAEDTEEAKTEVSANKGTSSGGEGAARSIAITSIDESTGVPYKTGPPKGKKSRATSQPATKEPGLVGDGAATEQETSQPKTRPAPRKFTRKEPSEDTREANSSET